MLDDNNPKTIIFFGRSGAGKGTQAKLLNGVLQERGRDVIYIETGRELRSFTKDTSNHTAVLTNEIMDKGELLPAFLPVWLWSDILVDNFTGRQDLILDGLARRISEAPILDSAMKFYNRKDVIIINITVTREEARKRLLTRGREDDNDLDIDERLNWYDRDVIPVLEFFEERKGYHYLDINGEQDREAVQKEIMDALAHLGS